LGLYFGGQDTNNPGDSTAKFFIAEPILACLWIGTPGKVSTGWLPWLVNHYFSRRKRHFSLPCRPAGLSLSKCLSV
jgi:hypothetical protein